MDPVEGAQDDGQADEEGIAGGEVAEEVPAVQDDQHDGEDEGEVPLCLPCPGAPSVADREAHELTHWPYRKWCEDCVRGRAVGPLHKKIPAASRESHVLRVHLDYAFLPEEVVESEDEFTAEGMARVSMTILIMVETLCDSVWAYSVNAKGYASDPWLPGKIASDLATVGVADTRIVIKTDTEPAIVDLRKAIGASRGGTPTGYDDSRVGDSNSNGRIERKIREVKGLIRTLRSGLKTTSGSKVSLESSIVPWIVRHAAYILTRCQVMPCGRTALTRIKGQKTHRPLVAFGEAVLFKVPKTANRVGDFEDRFQKGIWLGMTVQSAENIVGTADGAYRTAGIIRRAPDQRWSAGMVDSIVGTPDEPRPGSGSDKIPTYAKRREDQPVQKEVFQGARLPTPTVRPAYIYANDVREHGASEGCKACEAALRKGNSTGYTHPASCRLRFEELFRTAGSDRLRRADDRMNEAVFRASAVPEPANAEEEEEEEEIIMQYASADASSSSGPSKVSK